MWTTQNGLQWRVDTNRMSWSSCFSFELYSLVVLLMFLFSVFNYEHFSLWLCNADYWWDSFVNAHFKLREHPSRFECIKISMLSTKYKQEQLAHWRLSHDRPGVAVILQLAVSWACTRQQECGLRSHSDSDPSFNSLFQCEVGVISYLLKLYPEHVSMHPSC